MGRAVQIIVLPRPERPEKGGKTQKTEKKSRWDEKSQSLHHAVSFIEEGRPCPPRARRKAFSVTTIEDPDMAAAAISGVTSPAMASGTASRL